MLTPLVLSQVSAPRWMKTTGVVGFPRWEGDDARIHCH
jgi:hypothetical protein